MSALNFSFEEAVELAEMLEFIAGWLGQASPAMEAHFSSYMAGGSYSLGELRADVVRFAFLCGADPELFLAGREADT